MDKKFGIFLILFLCISLVSAGLGTFTQDSCVDIKTILNTSSVNISTLNYPNSTIAISNKEMTKIGLTFNYTFCDTDDLGVYIYDYFDAEGNVYVNDFEITGNGKPTPSGAVASLFIIGFLITAVFLVFMILVTLGHFASLDVDIVDVAFNWGIYFGIIVLYITEQFYLGNPDLHNWLVLLIQIGAFTSVFLPLLAFILSITLGGIKRKKLVVNAPRIKFWRGR